MFIYIYIYICVCVCVCVCVCIQLLCSSLVPWVFCLWIKFKFKTLHSKPINTDSAFHPARHNIKAVQTGCFILKELVCVDWKRKSTTWKLRLVFYSAGTVRTSSSRDRTLRSLWDNCSKEARGVGRRGAARIYRSFCNNDLIRTSEDYC